MIKTCIYDTEICTLEEDLTISDLMCKNTGPQVDGVENVCILKT